LFGNGETNTRLDYKKLEVEEEIGKREKIWRCNFYLYCRGLFQLYLWLCFCSSLTVISFRSSIWEIPSIGRSCRDCLCISGELFCNDENGITNDMSIACHSFAQCLMFYVFLVVDSAF